VFGIENSETWQNMTELRADGSAYFAGMLTSAVNGGPYFK
jgi:hypothetical protein